ncbi:MAG: GNAT family N-acetyltransferase [Candidatus Lokiarchaeota archaeon]|nr:GNAT family N-acetyltransferase [Candidatus Lokiarchaeota archaeon]
MEFIVSYDLNEFERYYKTSWESIPNREQASLDEFERDIILDNPSHLIVWKKRNRIIGNAIWHETYTDKHSEQDPRDDDDRKILEELIGKSRECVELHELWLKVEYRRKGYGKKFFSFFEKYLADFGFKYLIHYTDNENAMNICRKRGYKEGYGVKAGDYTWYVFALEL